MRRKTIEDHLAPAPLAVRRAMLEDRDNLLRGAAAVVGRFFVEIKRRREPMDTPSPETFRLAAKSESTLRTLLVSLDRYAPQVSTASGRIVRAEWYARRSKAGSSRVRGRAPLPTEAPEAWPPLWRKLFPGLLTASLAETSKRRYIASLDRLAALLPEIEVGPEPSFYLGFCLSEVLERDAIDEGHRKVRARSIAGYLDALVSLGRHGGLQDTDLAGLRRMRDLLLQRARQQGKLKTARIGALMERGGFEFLAQVVGDLYQAAEMAPDHSAQRAALLQAAALIGLHMNKPGRTGDVASWRLGHELKRDRCGDWSLEWEQQKTDTGTGVDGLWPEVSRLLDLWILGGRPDRHVRLRYDELAGKNWLTLSDRTHPSRWPSDIIKRYAGVPSHDLRTLAADYLRWHDPATAPDVISAHLGHRSRAAGDEYRALAEGDAAARVWADVRQQIMAGNSMPREEASKEQF